MPITSSSDEARELFIEGREYLENYRSTKADSMFRKALELDPNFALAQLLLIDQTGVPKAMRLAEFVTEGEKMMIKAYFNYLTGKLDLCNIYLDSLIEIHPADKHCFYFAGLLYSNRDPESAIDYFDQAIRKDRYFAPPYCGIALQQIELGGHVQAQEWFYKYFGLYSESGYAHIAYGNLLMKLGMEEDAIDQFKKALSVDPLQIYAYNNIIFACIELGDFARAFDYCNALEKDPNNQITVRELFTISNRQRVLPLKAIISFISGDFEGSLRHIDSWLIISKESLDYLSLLYTMNLKAWYAFRAGKPENALEILNEAIYLGETMDLDPDLKRSRIMWLKGTISVIYGNRGNLPEAERYFNEAKEMVRARDNSITDKNFLRLYEGILEIHRGNYENAICILHLAADRTSVSNQFYLAKAYDLSGKKQEAINYYRLASQSTNPYFTGLFYNESKDRIRILENELRDSEL
jgi:tetratricopeptide (TPR) repeat protein